MPIPDNISAIASIVAADWKDMYFGARPYLEAMYSLNSVQDAYGADSAKSIVCYFLANAQTWKGTAAREVKQKLNQLLKQRR